MFWVKGHPDTNVRQDDFDNANDADDVSHRHTQPQHCCQDERQHDKNESILRSTLDELDEERQRVKELQRQIEALKQKQKRQQEQQQQRQRREQQSKKRQTNHDGSSISPKAYAKMQKEAEGFRHIVDALTKGRPAVDAAVAALNRPDTQRSSNKTHHPASRLPLHVVRFLEFAPWLAEASSSVTDELYEWQVFHAGAWKGKLNFFPAFFKALPVLQPQQGDNAPMTGVYTNQSITQRYDLAKHGYFDPNSTDPDAPSWKWIGNWQVDSSADEGFVDQEGWAYSREAGLSVIPLSYVAQELSDKVGRPVVATGRPTMMFRRRKWTRRRMLVNYPMASEQTVHYLALKVKNEELLMANLGLKSHLQREQQALLEKEAEQQAWEEERKHLESRLVKLEHQAKHYQDLLERQRGRPHFSFVFSSNAPKAKTASKVVEDYDDDCSTVSSTSSNSSLTSIQDQHDDAHCIAHCEDSEASEDHTEQMTMALKNMDQLLLQPQDTVDCRDDVDCNNNESTGRKSKPKGVSIFGWGHQHPKEEAPLSTDVTDYSSPLEEVSVTEPVPEVEICSLVTESEDDSERTVEEEEDAGDKLALMQVVPSRDDQLLGQERKSFLQKLFAH